jgi:hypothetical protein
MLKVTYASNCDLVNIEGKFNLTIQRERNDIRSLLEVLHSEKKLEDLFGSKSIANALFKRLKEWSYVDENQRLTSIGEAAIQNPLIEETEKGTYSIDVNKIALLDGDYWVVTEITRKLSDERRTLQNYISRTVLSGNQCVIDNESRETTLFTKLEPYGEQKPTRVMESQPSTSRLDFDIINQTYKSRDHWLKCGVDLFPKIKDKVLSILSQNEYGVFDLDKRRLTIKSLKDFTEQDLIKGVLSTYSKDGIVIENIPIEITDKKQAIEYAYLYAYYNLANNNYLSFTELDEMFQNEILAKDIYAENLKDQLSTFSYSMSGFQQNLSKDKYDTLSYKLGILQYLLDLKIQNNEFSKVKNYEQLSRLLTKQVAPEEVDKVFLVMGYPFVKNARNRIIEALSALRAKYPNITIVQKGNKQIKDSAIESQVGQMGVDITENDSILKSFHDRYVLFRLHNGTFVSYLVTCEFGQYFSQDNGSNMGSIIKIESKELKKGDTDLIKIIRG